MEEINHKDTKNTKNRKNISAKRYGSGESGVALAIVALVLLLLTLLIISAHFMMVSQTVSTSNYRNSTQAYYVAEAGIQRTIDWFSHQYSSPDWTVLGLLGNRYPSRLSGNNYVILDTSPANNSTFPVTATVDSFRNYLDAVNSYDLVGAGTLQGEYTVQATLLSSRPVQTFLIGSTNSERWLIHSTGRVRNSTYNSVVAQTESIAVIETIITPLITHAICANAITLSGGSITGSFDSSTGSSVTQTTNGDAGSYSTSTGPFQLSGGGTMINGQFDIPTAQQSGALCGPTYVSSGCGTNFCDPLPAIPNFCPSGSSTSSPAPSNFIASTTCPTNGCPSPGTVGDYSQSGAAGSLSLPGSATGNACFWFNKFTISGAGLFTINNLGGRTGTGRLDIYMNELTLSGGSTLAIVSNKTNPIYIYINNKLAASGGSIANSPLNDLGLFILYSGTSQGDFSGTSATGAVIYAPNAKLVLSGASGVYGAIIANEVEDTGGSPVFFDRALKDNLVKLSFAPVAQVRRIY